MCVYICIDMYIYIYVRVHIHVKGELMHMLVCIQDNLSRPFHQTDSSLNPKP